MPRIPHHLIDVFRAHVEKAPEAQAMTWVPERSQDDAQHLTRLDLYEASQGIAAGLSQLSWSKSEPRMALLAFAPGLQFIQAFLACLMAGVIAVPVPLPRRGYGVQILEAIVNNCGATKLLTSAQEQSKLHSLLSASPALASLHMLTTEQLQTQANASGATVQKTAQEFAFIQYTSGSTSKPKGVLVGHANLMANLALIDKSFGINSQSGVVVSWLPHYHDMGLIGSLLTPVHAGIPCISMAPSAFIKRPLRWLQIISAQQADRSVMSGGPNFAYQHCIDRVAAEDVLSLSLQCWKTAFNGAEPIKADTLQKFVEHFAPAGFSTKQLLTCYGLAETTLFATGSHDPVFLGASAQGLESGRVRPPLSVADARQLVSSGQADPDRIVIVDPVTELRLPDGAVGEIWLTGDSVPQSYFNDEQQSAATFQARLAEQTDVRYLVTGDIGAIVDGNLYVTGRSKELLIINGRNIYPHDIEALLQNSEVGIDGVVVFSYDDATAKSEGIVAICELGRSARHWFLNDAEQTLSPELEKMAGKIRIAAAGAEVSISHLRFVGPMGIGKTTSGKTSYGHNRRAFYALPEQVRRRSSSAEFRVND